MPMYRKSLLILLLIAAAVAGETYYGCYTQDKETVQLDAASATDETQQEAAVTVYVTGAVNKPGVVSIKEGACAADAVNACGGLLPTADGDKINMAQVLKDGQQLRIPEKQEASNVQTAAKGAKSSSAATAGTKAAAGGIVNINTASAEELDTLPGIGPAMAQRIIEYRETEGSFSAVEDIKKVRGIGEAKFQKMRDKICI